MRKLSMVGIGALTILLVSGSASAATYTAQDVATHATASNCWSIVNGKVYNLTGYVNHPGGQGAITALCGVNGTTAFNNKHGNSTPASTTIASFYIGDLTTTTSTATTTPPIATTTPPVVTTSTGVQAEYRGNVERQPKVINVRSNEKVQVIVYGNATIDVKKITRSTVLFAGAKSREAKIKDVNKDGLQDIIFSFYPKQMIDLQSAVGTTTTSTTAIAKLTFSTASSTAYSKDLTVNLRYAQKLKKHEDESRDHEEKKEVKKLEIKKVNLNTKVETHKETEKKEMKSESKSEYRSKSESKKSKN
ncbi:MAG: cytochrome b5-like heme/steroid binding domain-containing protein [Candidatus Falkowbacteria bacterium]